MKEKNLMIFSNLSSKLAAFTLVGSLATCSLAACSSSESLLEDTILEGAVVITFEDGSRDVAVRYQPCDRKGEEGVYFHYCSVVSEEYYSDLDCEHSHILAFAELGHYDIAAVENITSYFNADDFKKITKEELTEEDAISIITRIITEEDAKTLTK